MEISDLVADMGKRSFNEIEVFQCEEKEQLLPDSINCLAVQAYLRMCNLKYNVTYTNNTKDMSPTGQEPLLMCDTILASDFDTIVRFLQQKDISLTKLLLLSEVTEMNAYVSLIRLILSNAVNYFTWAESVSYKTSTKASFRNIYPWPLNWVLAARKREEELRKLSAMGWRNKSLEEVNKEVELCLNALSEKLDKTYFFGYAPTELDAILFAHVYSILTTQPKSQLASTIIHYPNILLHCKTVLAEYFKEFKSNVSLYGLGAFHV